MEGAGKKSSYGDFVNLKASLTRSEEGGKKADLCVRFVWVGPNKSDKRDIRAAKNSQKNKKKGGALKAPFGFI